MSRRHDIEPEDRYKFGDDIWHSPPLNCPHCGTFTGGAACNFYPCLEKRNYEDLVDKGFIDDAPGEDIPFYPMDCPICGKEDKGGHTCLAQS